MFFVYNVTLRLIYALAFLFSFFHRKLRQNFIMRKVPLNLPKQRGEVVWFHASSVGEYEQARIVAQKLKKKYPHFFIFFTVYSYSAYSQRQEDTVFDYLYPLPVDFPKKMQNLLDVVKPRIIIYAKYDVWPNLCYLAKKKGVKQILISATLPKNSLRLKFPFSLFFRRIYLLLDAVYAIHSFHQSNFHRLKVPSEVFGDTRFDAVKERVKKLPGEILNKIKKYLGKSQVLVAGSTYPICEKWLLDFLLLEPKISLILVPHEVYDRRIAAIKEELAQRSISYLCYSDLQKEPVEKKVRVFVVDVTGILPYLYSLGHFAYVGGGFTGKVHSVLEPAYFGLPILTGPKMENSQEAIELFQRKLLTIANYPEPKLLFEFVNKYRNQTLYKQVQKAIKEYFKENCGATERILRALEQTAQLVPAGRKTPHKKEAPQT